jgi:sortase A
VIGVVAALCIVAVLAGQAWAIPRLRRQEPVRAHAANAAAPVAPAVAPRPEEPMGRVIGVLRRRRWLRHSLSFASVVIGLVAVGMIGYPFYTNLYADRLQDELGRQIASDELRQAYESGTVQEGDSLTRIIIPAIDIDVVVVEGVTPAALRAGAGHYPSTPLPCEDGNVAIAGHRTTYGRPFHNLDLLQAGDEIILETPIGRCTYAVSEASPLIVRPDDVSVIAPTAEPSLTLTTCHPKGSARQRLIVQATRVDTTSIPA